MRAVATFRPMGSKRKALGTEGFDLPIDKRENNYTELQPRSEGIESNVNLHRPLGGKSAKEDHNDMRVNETALIMYAQTGLRANARATTKFTQATLKKAEQIAQQNTFSLFTLKDSLITCKVARRWLLLRREQKLKRLEKEMAADKEVVLVMAGEATAPIAGVRVHTPTISGYAAAPTAPTTRKA